MAKPALEAAAKDVVTNKMATFVSDKLDPLEVRVNQLGSNLTSRTAQIEDLVQHSQVTLKESTNALAMLQLVAAALAFDIGAFDELARIELSTNKPFNEIAWRIRLNMIAAARMMDIHEKGLDISTLTNVIDFKHATFQEYTNIIALVPDLIKRCMLLSALFGEDRFPKLEVLDYMFQLHDTERNALTIGHIQRLLDTETHIGRNFVGRKAYTDWYRANRTNYVSLLGKDGTQRK